MSSEVQESWKAKILGTLAGWIMRFWCLTVRMEIVDRCGLGKDGAFTGRLILVLWHNRIFVGPTAWTRVSRKQRRMVVLTSASNDGAMLARAVGVLGVGSVRGSSSRRGAAALVAMRRALRDGADCTVTPDGPRGPKYVLQPGVVKLAETSGARVIPLHVEYGKAWKLGSWDRFRLPKPFSRVRVIFDEALVVPPGLSDADFEAWRSRIETILRDGVEDFQEES